MLTNSRVLAPFLASLLLAAACNSPAVIGGSGGSGGGAGTGTGGGAAGAGGSGGNASPDAAGGQAGSSVPDAGSGADVARDQASPVDRPPTATPDGGPVNPPAQPPGPWARGVEISMVEAAQVVFIKLAASTTAGQPPTLVPVAMRNAPLIEGKTMVFRVHVRTTAGFTARQLRAVLTVEFAGSKVDLEATKMVAASSTLNDFNSTFNIILPADQVKANGAFAVSVYEMGMPVGPEPTLQPKFGGELGVKGGRMEVHVVVVPYNITSMTPAQMTKLAGDFTDLYPIQKVNIRMAEPAMLPAWSSSAAFALLRDRKMTEMAKPWEYYHMIANAMNGAAGTATSGRIAFTITRTPNIDGNTNTFAHEIGHNHGMGHMPGCGAAGADNSYPYQPNLAPEGVTWPAGFMGVNGYSISTNTFKSTVMFRELMSYCRPRWVSDFVYNKFEVRVRQTIAMIPAGMADQEISRRSLQGWAGPGESINFGLALGQLVDESATPITDDQYARLTLTDGSTLKVPVAVTLASDDVTKEFAINLDTDQYTADQVVLAEVFVGNQRTVVDVAPMHLKSKR